MGQSYKDIEDDGINNSATRATDNLIASPPEKHEHKDFRVNMGYLLLFIITVNIAGINVGYVLAYTNNATPIIDVKFNWTSASDKALYNSLIGASAVLGLAIGAVMGGKIIAIGRWRGYVLSCVLGIIGVAITLI
jgi:MFS family permease